MSFYPADFGLLKLGRGTQQTDGQIDGRTDNRAQFIMHPSLRGGGIINANADWV